MFIPRNVIIGLIIIHGYMYTMEQNSVPEQIAEWRSQWENINGDQILSHPYDALRSLKDVEEDAYEYGGDKMINLYCTNQNKIKLLALMYSDSKALLKHQPQTIRAKLKQRNLDVLCTRWELIRDNELKNEIEYVAFDRDRACITIRFREIMPFRRLERIFSILGSEFHLNISPVGELRLREIESILNHFPIKEGNMS